MDKFNKCEGTFALLDLWKPSSFTYLQDETGSPPTLETWDALNHQIDNDGAFMEEHDVSKFFKFLSSLSFPDITTLDYRPCQTQEASESPSEELSSDSVEELTINPLEAETVNDDPWFDVHVLIPIEKTRNFRSWEIFHDKTSMEPRNTYWSEGGPLAMDAVLCLPENSSDGCPGNVELPLPSFSPLLVVSILVTFVHHRLKIFRECLFSD